MKEEYYTITAENGLHARPAGYLVKKAGEFEAIIQISCNGKSADARKLFALMKLGVKQNDIIKITADGKDEDSALQKIMLFIKENF